MTRKAAGGAAIDHVPHLSAEALLVKAADKLHNLSSLLADLRTAENPEDVWRPFTRGPEQTLRMSRVLVEALVQRLEADLAQALRSALEALEAAADSGPAPPRSSEA
ncbi:MAG: hypothetical protein QGI93_00380 [Planctomycetota bacterium]|nr:hypothetical protein [Planctomycetota bacterium]